MSLEEKELCLTPNTSTSNSSIDSINNNDTVLNVNNDKVCVECAVEEVNVKTNEQHDSRFESLPKDNEHNQFDDMSNIADIIIDLNIQHNNYSQEIVVSENSTNASECNVLKSDNVGSATDNNTVRESIISKVIETEDSCNKSESNVLKSDNVGSDADNNSVRESIVSKVLETETNCNKSESNALTSENVESDTDNNLKESKASKLIESNANSGNEGTKEDSNRKEVGK